MTGTGRACSTVVGGSDGSDSSLAGACGAALVVAGGVPVVHATG